MRRAPMAAILLALFLELVGFSVLFPLVERMMHHYLEQGGLAALLVDWLRDLQGDVELPPQQITALFGGVLMGAYALLQFLCAPLWGALSDRIGRRPVLLMTVAGNLLGNLLWIWADSFALLLLSRVICGLAAGNLSVATAAVADLSPGADRTRAMALVGMTFGLGFVIGPALGAAGMLLLPGPLGTDSSGWGLHPFSGCAALVVGLGLLNLLWIWRRIGETLSPDVETPAHRNPLALLVGAGLGPAVRRAALITLLFTVAFAAVEATLVFLVAQSLAWGVGGMASLFVTLGLTSAAVQGVLIRRLAPFLGERRLAAIGMVLMVPSFLMLAMLPQLPSPILLLAAVLLLGAGIGCTMPALTALTSLLAPTDRQGAALGSFRSAGALGRAIGPFLGAGLYFTWGPAAAYLGAAAALALPLALLITLPDPRVHRSPLLAL